MAHPPEPAQNLNGKLRFDVYEADPRSGELLKYGLRVPLPTRPFRALLVLLQHANQVVTRGELQNHLWSSEVFIDFDHGLNTVIATIRRALNDNADKPRFIETVGGRGYRFIGEVQADLPESKPQTVAGPAVEASEISSGAPGLPAGGSLEEASRDSAPVVLRRPIRRLHLGLAAAGLLLLMAGLTFFVAKTYYGRRGAGQTASAGAPIQSLAVLPLENLSGDPNQEYLADGMTDELLTSLASIRSLRVASRTSVMHLKGTQKTMPEVARELNVDAVVEGSVSRVGNQLRIRTQLIRGASDEHLWAASYTTNLKDVFHVQAEIAQQIAGEIKGRLTATEQRSIADSRRSTNPEAYEAYLKGRYHFNQFNTEGFKKSCVYYEQAIKADPAYAPGYAGMADCYTALASTGLMQPEEAMPKARTMARKAIALDDTLADAHGILGTILLNYDWDWPAAKIELQRTSELDPNNSDTHLRLVSYYRTVGKVDDAEREAKLAQELDPVSLKACGSLGWTDVAAGRYEKAEPELKKCLELDPNFPVAHNGLFFVYDHKELFSRAIAEAESGLRAEQDNELADSVDKIYRSRGYGVARKFFFEGLLKDTKEPFIAAVSYAQTGNKAKALDNLELAYRQRSSHMKELKVNSIFDGLRQEPRFQQLLKNLRLAD